MANTKAQLFVPQAIENRALAIKHLMVQLAQEAEALRFDYLACGGDTMDGLAAYDFGQYALTLTEFQEGMLDLATTHNSISLSGLISGGGFAKVLKLTSGK
jgi:hypothetical protein